MRHIRVYYLLIIFTFLVTGCSGVDKEELSTDTKITIEPYNISDKEGLLISKTDVGRIEFFELNGTLNKEEDLQFSVEVFENGEFKEELLQTWDAPEISYKESFISFGINNSTEEDHTVKLINGVPSGLATTYYPANMTSSSFGKLIIEKVTLEKNKPMYLVAWLGTTKNGLSSVGGQNGELPQGIKESELAFIYKILWTDQENK